MSAQLIPGVCATTLAQCPDVVSLDLAHEMISDDYSGHILKPLAELAERHLGYLVVPSTLNRAIQDEAGDALIGG